MLKRYPQIPLIQAGGHQPYAKAGGQMPGPALLAMLGGRTLGGYNPQDVTRSLQSLASAYPNTVLGRLSGVGSPGTGADWELTPDQHDRNQQHSEDQMRGWQSGAEEQRAQRRARNRRLPARRSNRGRRA
jgi:hypothetical protein